MDLREATRQTLVKLILTVGCVLVLAGEALASSGGQARKVDGEVLAVNTYDTPNTIVLRAYTSTKQELIVGATVDPDVDIHRGSKVVSLGDIRVGDQVKLTYVKTLDGLVARSIKAR